VYSNPAWTAPGRMKKSPPKLHIALSSINNTFDRGGKMENLISVTIVSSLFLLWMPLFLSPPGSTRISLRHEYVKRIVIMRKFFRGFKTKELSTGLEKTG
jgi:hypothetical protein